MSQTSDSPRAVAVEALAVADQTLPLNRHRLGPRTFTLPQRFACLVLKAFVRTH